MTGAHIRPCDVTETSIYIGEVLEADIALGRRRKASQLQARDAASCLSAPKDARSEPVLPCWVEERQAVTLLPVAAAATLHIPARPLIPSSHSGNSDPALPTGSHELQIIFPLSKDHLITLLQFNVLRACVVNRQLLSPLEPHSMSDCASSPPGVLLRLPSPDALPPSLHPTCAPAHRPPRGVDQHRPTPGLAR